MVFNVGTIINHPPENGLYHLSMVIWGMVYCCFTHINYHVKFYHVIPLGLRGYHGMTMFNDPHESK